MMRKLMGLVCLGLVGCLSLNFSFAQLSFDRTRVIFNHGKSTSQSIVVSNNNETAPYLAQSWVEDDKGNKITGPLVALPILQRVNPKEDKQIKISLIGDTASLPKDRESLFYFNVLGVPPKEGDENKISIILQSKLKLFYRPKGLPQYEENKWIEEMKVQKTNKGFTLENTSPYHIVIYGFSAGKSSKMIEKDLVLNPFSSTNIDVSISGNTPTIYFVNDYGGGTSLNYKCNISCEILKL